MAVYKYVVLLDQEAEVVHNVSISAEKLRSFLELCFQNAAYFSFTRARWRNCRNHRLQNRIESFRIATIQTEKWFGYDYTGLPQELRCSIEVNLYRADRVVIDHLLRWMDDIFMQVLKNGTISPSTQTLEDLCIFSESGLILVTVSHEQILYVVPQNADFEQELHKYGKWQILGDDIVVGMPSDIPELFITSQDEYKPY